jgi:hypothetical protein
LGDQSLYFMSNTVVTSWCTYLGGPDLACASFAVMTSRYSVRKLGGLCLRTGGGL